MRTHIVTPEWRAYMAANRRAQTVYRLEQVVVETQQPKTAREVGSGTGICDRCGIDSTSLSCQKCPPCYQYLYRRANPTRRVRTCPECDRPHRTPGRVCGACRSRRHRQKKAS